MEDYLYRKGTWQEVLESARETAGKEPLDKEPSEKWKVGMLIAEHSPIRCLVYRWRWNDIKYWITNHLVRHSWEPFIRSQRADRNGMTPEERDNLPQGASVQMIGEANAQHMIDTSRKRLCFKADPQTRMKWEWLKDNMKDIDPELYFVMVPNCIYRGGCPEMQTCGFYGKMLEKVAKMSNVIPNMFFDIFWRYSFYNHYMYKGGDVNGEK